MFALLYNIYGNIPIGCDTMKKLLIACLLLIPSSTALQANTGTPDTSFYSSLEGQLRDYYLVCTGDTTRDKPLSFIMNWKRTIDSAVETPDFPALVKQYMAATGLKFHETYPCEVVSWKQNHDKKLKQEEEYLTRIHAERQEAVQESTAVAKEIAAAIVQPGCFSEIPFGISKQAFIWLVERKNLTDAIIDDGNVFRSSSMTFGDRSYTAAFHFDNKGLYSFYELESESCSADSIDAGARAQAEYLSSIYQSALGSTPDRINRIGFFDITPGKLALYKVWIGKKKPTVFVGLATFKYRYYAKAIVKKPE